jgi:feruloyl esterase
LESALEWIWFGRSSEERFYSAATWRYPEKFFADYVHARNDWTVREFDLETDLKSARRGAIGIAVAAEDPDLSAFAQRGGRLIQWHGWHDMGIPARNSIRYYEAVKSKMGASAVASFYRLFMGTGVGHCGGGPAPDAIGGAFGRHAPQRNADHDVMEALARWIEEGKSPELIIATKYADDIVVAQRPWCAYPQVARWDRHGDRNKATSYQCAVPSGGH